MTILKLFLSLIRSYCECGSRLKATGRSADVLIYTRNGTSNARHLEFRYIGQCPYSHLLIIKTGAPQKNVGLDTSMVSRLQVISCFMTSTAQRDLTFLHRAKQGILIFDTEANFYFHFRFSVELLYEFSLSIVHYQAT